jgi:hypothetical protein
LPNRRPRGWGSRRGRPHGGPGMPCPSPAGSGPPCLDIRLRRIDFGGRPSSGDRLQGVTSLSFDTLGPDHEEGNQEQDGSHSIGCSRRADHPWLSLSRRPVCAKPPVRLNLRCRRRPGRAELTVKGDRPKSYETEGHWFESSRARSKGRSQTPMDIGIR